MLTVCVIIQADENDGQAKSVRSCPGDYRILLRMLELQRRNDDEDSTDYDQHINQFLAHIFLLLVFLDRNFLTRLYLALL